MSIPPSFSSSEFLKSPVCLQGCARSAGVNSTRALITMQDAEQMAPSWGKGRGAAADKSCLGFSRKKGTKP